jgi:hypothetical protein
LRFAAKYAHKETAKPNTKQIQNKYNDQNKKKRKQTTCQCEIFGFEF